MPDQRSSSTIFKAARSVRPAPIKGALNGQDRRKPKKESAGPAAWLPLLGALIGVLGVVVGGAIGYFSTQTAARNGKLLELKGVAYSEFLAAQAVAQSGPTPEARAAAVVQVQTSIFKVFAFADAKTVAAIAAERRTRGPQCSITPGAVSVYQAIRQDTLGADTEKMSDEDIAMALFACTVAPAPSKVPG